MGAPSAPTEWRVLSSAPSSPGLHAVCHWDGFDLMNRRDKIRVLYLFGSLGFGGTDLRIVTLARLLDRNRIVPYLNCYHGSIDSRCEIGHLQYCDIRFSRIRSVTFLRAFRRYARLIRCRSIDIVQASFYEESFLAALLQQRTGVAAIYHKVDLFPPPPGLVDTAAVRFRNRHLDYVAANSEAVRSRLSVTEGLATSRTSVIYNGVDLVRFHPACDEDRPSVIAELGLPAQRLNIGVTANLWAYKGLDVLIAAMPAVARAVGLVSLLILGDGPERGALERQITHLELQDHVRLLGNLADVSQVLRVCDVAVLPSLTEGLPNAVLEYMATGLPTVATSAGGIPEIVADGDTGFLVPPGDSSTTADRLVRLLQDRALRAQMGSRARMVAEQQFGIDRMCADFLALYESAAQLARKRMVP